MRTAREWDTRRAGSAPHLPNLSSRRILEVTWCPWRVRRGYTRRGTARPGSSLGTERRTLLEIHIKPSAMTPSPSACSVL